MSNTVHRSFTPPKPRLNRSFSQFWVERVSVIRKRYVLFACVAFWLHGATVGLVFEGEKGLLNRLGLTLFVAALPAFFAVRHRHSRRLCAAMVYCEIGSLLMSFSVSIAWFRNPKNLKPLPDIGHDILQEWKEVHLPHSSYSLVSLEGRVVPDVFLLIMTVATLSFIFKQKLKWVILRRFFVIYGTLMLFRSVTVIVTR